MEQNARSNVAVLPIGRESSCAVRAPIPWPAIAGVPHPQGGDQQEGEVVGAAAEPLLALALRRTTYRQGLLREGKEEYKRIEQSIIKKVLKRAGCTRIVHPAHMRYKS